MQLEDTITCLGTASLVVSPVRLVNTSQDQVHIFALPASRANINLLQDKPHVSIAAVAKLIGE